MRPTLSLVIVIIYLTGPVKELFTPPGKAKCPFKDGVVKKLTEHHGVFVGSLNSTVDILGKDSVVLSATDGRVSDVIFIQGLKYVSIRVDTTIYTYADIDRVLVQEVTNPTLNGWSASPERMVNMPGIPMISSALLFDTVESLNVSIFKCLVPLFEDLLLQLNKNKIMTTR